MTGISEGTQGANYSEGACTCGRKSLSASTESDLAPVEQARRRSDLRAGTRVLSSALEQLTIIRLDIPRARRGYGLDGRFRAAIIELRDLRDEYRRALAEMDQASATRGW